MLKKLLEKLKAKLHVSKDEYEACFQEDLRNKNFIIQDGLQAIKEFAKQENQDAPVLERGRMQNQGRGMSQGGYNGRPVQQYQYQEQQQRRTPRFPDDASLKQFMDTIRLQK